MKKKDNSFKNFNLSIQENIDLKEKIKSKKFFTNVHNAITQIYSSIKSGGKLMICGNGGSAADAQHLAAELLVRLIPKNNRKPIPAISLLQDSSTFTACSNDYNFNEIFKRNFIALHKKGDVLLIISTSGNSKNIINVLKESKKRKIKSIGFLGSNGGLAKKYCDISIVIPSSRTARIQEAHIFLGHFILENVEKKLFY
tara:strand:+ start:7102 stop:7698 length:597 start_codon:yes stop_codon:yes gene_type:complete